MFAESGTKSRGSERAGRQRRRGYSFAEVLFAVAVLGIGFIMVAAIFPVAIQQTQAAMEETIGTAATRNGSAYLQGTMYFTAAGLPHTGAGGSTASGTGPADPPMLFMFNDPRMAGGFGPAGAATPDKLWDSVKNSLIVANDPRFAIMALYSRPQGAPFAKIVVFGVRIRIRDAYKSVGQYNDVTRRNANVCAELEPRPVAVQLKDNTVSGAPDEILIRNIKKAEDPLGTISETSNAAQAAAEGAYVVISDDRTGDSTGTPNTNYYGRSNGRIYQLGRDLGASGAFRRFELVPGQDMQSDEEDIPYAKNGVTGSKDAIAFVVGRGYADLSIPNSYAGGVQVVQKYENVVPLKAAVVAPVTPP